MIVLLLEIHTLLLNSIFQLQYPGEIHNHTVVYVRQAKNITIPTNIHTAVGDYSCHLESYDMLLCCCVGGLYSAEGQFLQDTGNHTPCDTGLHPRRHESLNINIQSAE